MSPEKQGLIKPVQEDSSDDGIPNLEILETTEITEEDINRWEDEGGAVNTDAGIA